MKTIAFLSAYSLEREPAIKNRLLPFMKKFLEKNYKVILLSPDCEAFILDGDFCHHSITAHLLSKKKFFKRAYQELRLARKLFKSARDHKVDYYFVSIPSMFLLFSLFSIKGKDIILDIRDLTWEYLSDKKLVNRLIKRVCRLLAHWNSRYAKYILVSNPSEQTYFSSHQNVSLLPNGISLDKFNKVRTIEQHSTQNSSLCVAYVGNLGLGQNLKTLLQAARALPLIKVVIVGTGAQEQDLKHYCETNKLINVEFLGSVDWEDTLNIYRRADLLYAQLKDEFALARPSKLYEYLATGKPIIYGGCGEALTFLKAFENISLIKACDVDALIHTIKNFENKHKPFSQSRNNVKQIKNQYIREHKVNNWFQSFEAEEN